MFQLLVSEKDRVDFDEKVFLFAKMCVRAFGNIKLSNDTMKIYWKIFNIDVHVDDKEEAYGRFEMQFRNGWYDF